MKNARFSFDKIIRDRGKYIEAIKRPLFTTGNKETDMRDWFKKLTKRLDIIREKQKKLFFIGNGASCSIASHFAADFTKRAGIPSFANNDGTLLTCYSNDISFEKAYAEILKNTMGEGDGLFVISSSGESKNILNAVKSARSMRKDILIVTFSAFSRNNPLRKTGDFNIYLAADDYGCAESSHAYYLHLLLDIFENLRKK